jgi:hypothetical protein
MFTSAARAGSDETAPRVAAMRRVQPRRAVLTLPCEFRLFLWANLRLTVCR